MGTERDYWDKKFLDKEVIFPKKEKFLLGLWITYVASLLCVCIKGVLNGLIRTRFCVNCVDDKVAKRLINMIQIIWLVLPTVDAIPPLNTPSCLYILPFNRLSKEKDSSPV